MAQKLMEITAMAMAIIKLALVIKGESVPDEVRRG
jgi:hypothetical protein